MSEVRGHREEVQLRPTLSMEKGWPYCVCTLPSHCQPPLPKAVLPPAYSISHISSDADVGGTFSCVWREWFYQVLGSYKAENEPNLCLDMYFFSSFRLSFENMFFKSGYLSPRVCLLGMFLMHYCSLF